MSKTLWLVGTLLMLIVLALITGFAPLYWLFYVVVGGTVLGFLWAWLQSRGLEARVEEMTPHPQVGQNVNLRVVVTEKAGLPRLGLTARLVSDFATIDEEDFSIRPRGESTWSVSGLCRRRGLNSVGTVAMVSGDPTGLVRLECRIGKPQSILVYPATIPLSRAVVEGQATGGEIGEAGQLVGHSPAASMVRQYAPGDGMTRIHWPTTARLDQLMTKDFEGAGINEIWIFADFQESVQAGSGDESTEEYMVTIVASLAKSLILDGHATGLVVEGDEAYRLAPRKDMNHMWSLMSTLALVRARGKTPLPSLISQESGNLGNGAVALVVAPRPGPGIGGLVQFMTRRGILVLPVFLDAASFGRTPDPRWLHNDPVEMPDWAVMIRRRDDLSTALGGVLDRLATY